MFEPKRLHPIFIVITIGKRIKNVIFTFIALFFIGNKGNGGWIFLLGASVIVVIAIIIMSILSWLKYTYRLEQGEIRIEYGVFIRKKRYIPFERIQSLISLKAYYSVCLEWLSAKLKQLVEAGQMRLKPF